MQLEVGESNNRGDAGAFRLVVSKSDVEEVEDRQGNVSGVVGSVLPSDRVSLSEWLQMRGIVTCTLYAG